MNTESQCIKVVRFMRKHGSITSAQAFYRLGCSRLAARIKDLKKRGTRIADRWVWKGDSRVKEYRLA